VWGGGEGKSFGPGSNTEQCFDRTIKGGTVFVLWITLHRQF